MINFNKCNLKIHFTLGKCKNKLFKLLVNNEELIPVDSGDLINAVYERQISLPTRVEIRTSGKDNNTDTIVDKDGKILEDLYVQIKEVSLDNFQLNEKYLHQKINIKTESGKMYTTSYIGFNGITVLNFQEKNVFSQVMVCNE